MDLLLLFQHRLFYGAILSFLLSLLITISLYINAEIWVSDFPPDIQEKHGPVSEESKKQKIIVGIAFLGIIVGVVGLALTHLDLLIDEEPTFFEMFISIYVMFLCFNLFALFILDWLFFVKIQPKFIILLETEGLKGYKDYYFHFRGFLIGLVILFVGSIFLVGVPSVLYLII